MRQNLFKWPPSKGPVWATFAIFSISLGAAWYSVATHHQDPKEWEYILQYLLQFALAGSLGAALTSYFTAALKEREEHRAQATKNREKAQERRTTRVAALQKFRNNLVETSHSIKKVRRTLRASSFPTSDGTDYYCERKVFECLMDKMEDMQLQTATLKDEVDAHQDLFGVGAEKNELHDLLETVECYLRELLRGYENQYADRRELNETDLIKLGPALATFIHRKGEDKPVKRKFFDPIFKARKLIVGLIEKNVPAEPETENKGKNMHR